MNEESLPESIDSDFSAINNAVTEDYRRVKQIRRYRSSRILKRNIVNLCLLLLTIGLVIFLISLAYWFYNNDPKQIIKIEGDETYNTTNYNIKEDINKLEQIIKDQKKINKQQKINPDQVKEKFIVFQERSITLSNGYRTSVHTGYKFKPNKIDYPYEQYCYMHNKDRVWIDLMNKKGKNLPTSHSSSGQPINSSDFKKAKSYCNFRD